ncbi:hypothetical protein SAMN05421874_110148 [Nonomuraea maritima]|uniref:Uncharacterized protein n=1 Tax=Nonomuraea maritima TaxID=683260 RepID=A0A1G9E6F7_9ACTN|nr:hypothetical protein SAMN05421874_110148 [Nonomuraea maritima]
MHHTHHHPLAPGTEPLPVPAKTSTARLSPITHRKHPPPHPCSTPHHPLTYAHHPLKVTIPLTVTTPLTHYPAHAHRPLSRHHPAHDLPRLRGRVQGGLTSTSGRTSGGAAATVPAATIARMRSAAAPSPTAREHSPRLSRSPPPAQTLALHDARHPLPQLHSPRHSPTPREGQPPVRRAAISWPRGREPPPATPKASPRPCVRHRRRTPLTGPTSHSRRRQRNPGAADGNAEVVDDVAGRQGR